jgi:3-hydroxyacyl-[acyl-carrier-protein] dehydratase
LDFERFQMIDRVDAIDCDTRIIRCSTFLPPESPVFASHFPEHPLWPATLMIEAVAQACGLLYLRLQDFARMPLLTHVERAKIRAMVAPPAQIAIEGRIVQDGSGYAAGAGVVRREGMTVAEAEVRLAVLPFPSERLRELVRAHALKLGVL